MHSTSVAYRDSTLLVPSKTANPLIVRNKTADLAGTDRMSERTETANAAYQDCGLALSEQILHRMVSDVTGIVIQSQSIWPY